ncbi:Ap4s1 protein, related [Neospora caninum Liverpool]|uniref:AP complex subunit sigma n=1 Tax=Neospora caninum (strain Liverpool) TaxID=572307 RepID=F0VNF5_NEOCL|nr:Ap4s1 protein, related [Neospora caninum Liverpool]CBZ55251.1 Ap4s1 protein, related [Neospora caninum Liverpool]CEL69981.1 TPA: Ap4s1 protein, related [Neospora caninum Liverpool]|eukprot:XP_003885279.1 Ap4s1 protein, related [Neospora caninum Liverpool]
MIRFVLLLNRQGKTRLSRWYEGGLSDQEKWKVESGIHAAVLQRQRRWANILDFRSYHLVYRQYAGLVFVVCIDSTENDLAVYEGIQLFVELLDKYFGTVCELDIIFHVDKVYFLLDQFIQAGEIVQTSPKLIVSRAKRLDGLD